MRAKELDSVELADGRRLAYATYGDPDGVPVVALHGCPDSHSIWRLADLAARRRGVRLVAPDRPGFGGSDPAPDRSIVDWADDVHELADRCGIGSFPVLALSGGGAFGCATAYRLAGRVTALGLLSVIGPLDIPGMTEGMDRSIRLNYSLADRAPWLLRLIVSGLGALARYRPALAARQILRTRPPADRAILMRPDVYKVLVDALPDNFAHPASVLHEFRLAVRPWGFDLSGIRAPTIVWQGGADTVHVPAMGRHLASAIRGSTLEFDPEGTAFTFLDRADEVLDALLRAASGSR